MKIGIIVAMEEELEPLLEQISTKLIEERKKQKIWQANYLNHELVIIKSGIGKVNAAIATQLLIDRYAIELVINFGTVGTLVNDIRIGDVIFANRFRYHDADATVFGYEMGQIPQMPAYYEVDVEPYILTNTDKYQVHVGEAVTSDTFASSDERINQIKHKFPDALICEMEVAAIAQTLYYEAIPFLSIKGVSDKAGSNGDVEFHENLRHSMENAADAVLRVLNKLSK